MATKIANALNVSLDYVVEKSDMEQLHGDMLKRSKAVSNLPLREGENKN